jgi:hypothetical protein
MPYYLVHAGTTLNKMDALGTWEGITLPAGVTVSDVFRARMAMLNGMVVITNAPSRNLQFDVETGELYLLNITPSPATAPTLAVGAAGEPSGTYRYVVSFAILIGARVLSESGWSPIAGPIEVTEERIGQARMRVFDDNLFSQGRRGGRYHSRGRIPDLGASLNCLAILTDFDGGSPGRIEDP